MELFRHKRGKPSHYSHYSHYSGRGSGEVVYEFVLFGTSPIGKPRLYFEPEQGIAYVAQLR